MPAAHKHYFIAKLWYKTKQLNIYHTLHPYTAEYLGDANILCCKGSIFKEFITQMHINI